MHSGHNNLETRETRASEIGKVDKFTGASQVPG